MGQELILLHQRLDCVEDGSLRLPTIFLVAFVTNSLQLAEASKNTTCVRITEVRTDGGPEVSLALLAPLGRTGSYPSIASFSRVRHESSQSSR